MRVAMFMPGLGPESLGWEVHQDFARAVTELGHNFRFLTTSSGLRSGQVGDVKALTTRPFLRTLGRITAPVFRTEGLVPAAAALAGYLRNEGRSIDVLHVEVAYPHGASAMLATQISGWDGPIVVTPMGEDTLVLKEAGYGFRRYPTPRALVDWTFRRSAYIRCISPMLEERIAKIAPKTPRRMLPLNISTAAANIAEDSILRRSERRLAARRDIDAKYHTSGRSLILALSRLHPFKGIETLVRALPQVLDAVLLIVGPSLKVVSFGDMATHLSAVADQVGVSDRVRLIDAVTPSRSLDMLAAADVVAVPSHLESLNKVCIESAAVGTPFIVTDTTGISAWVRGEGVGIVVPPADPVALGHALRNVLSGPWKIDLEKCSTFVKPFTPQAVASGMVDIYRAVLDRRLSHHNQSP